ncbi:MAG: zinc ribbon domain-containing protein [Lachnospiraceae bacterium]
MFRKILGCCRKVYNLMLADKIESYKTIGRFATITPAKYKKDYPYLREVDNLAKLADRGKYFVKVDKWFLSSQICHCCRTIYPKMKDLFIRTMRCDCGLTMSRDQNAAINIKKKGLRILKFA